MERLSKRRSAARPSNTACRPWDRRLPSLPPPTPPAHSACGHREEVKAQLGPEFVYGFLNPETRSTANVPVDTMGVWLKFMGGDPPGSMTVRGGRPALTTPERANRVQVFYDIREQRVAYNAPTW